MEDSQSEQEEWILAVCGTFATIILAVPDLSTTTFEQTFLLFFNEPVFFKAVVEMIQQDELKDSELGSYAALLFTATFYLQTRIRN